ncbi:MAG: ferrous iron transport protein A [Deltaproteobacteria bacterium]|nr:ferrous iron transport protein A [Deltaproteobacteria bacterium]
MSLYEVDDGNIVLIKRFKGGKRFSEKLNSMGVYEGMKISVIRRAPFSGPIMVEGVDTPVKVMIGRGMAKNIEVEILKN